MTDNKKLEEALEVLVSQHGLKSVVAQLAQHCFDSADKSGPSWVGQEKAIEWKRAGCQLHNSLSYFDPEVILS